MFTGKTINEPVRLEKQASKEPLMIWINSFVERNFYIIALATIIILLACFIITCFLIVGGSATESGLIYNHMGDVL